MALEDEIKSELRAKLESMMSDKKKDESSCVGEMKRLDANGCTKEEMKKRITAFGIGGQWKGREDEIKIELEIDTLLAPTIERMVKKTLQKNWKDKQLKDKNLGRGYTEWYRMKPNSMINLL